VRVATDVGGTFTDLIYLDEVTGETGMTKASTTPHNFAIGVEDTLDKSGINVPDTCAGYLSHPPNLEGKIRVCGWGLDFVSDNITGWQLTQT
jgi:hypothetical protein